MGKEQIHQILHRKDVPSDVKKIIKEFLLEMSLTTREKLIEDKKFLSAILETSPVGICLFTGPVIGQTNETMVQILGHDKDKLTRQDVCILFHDNQDNNYICEELFKNANPDNLEYIFEPFVSIETEYSVIGTGIGLHICRIIVEEQGDTIKAHSDGLRHGATIIIELSIYL